MEQADAQFNFVLAQVPWYVCIIIIIIIIIIHYYSLLLLFTIRIFIVMFNDPTLF